MIDTVAFTGSRIYTVHCEIDFERKEQTMQFENKLNPEQLKAVKQTEGPVLILAGAGSGKTRVLTHRIAYMLEEKDISPWNILAITFTNKAAGEMRERVDNLVGFGAESIWVSTFHSMCVRILRRHITRLGYDTSFTIYDADDQKSIMKAICKKLNIDTKQLKERAIMSAISSAKDELVDVEEFEKIAGGDKNQCKIAAAYREYQRQLRDNHALDFDDLIVKTVELFRHCPDVLDNYQERFRYIMVDEYQDTNTAQFELVRLLSLKYKNLCVVGDDDQSIYKFRGANIRNILDFEKNYPNAFVVKLEQNYRSTQNILNAANGVIRCNTGRKSKTLWSERGNGRKIYFRQFDNALEEAEHIVDDIVRKHRNGDAHYRDCAVLYRTNAQSRILEEMFIRENVPYRVVGGINFYARKEIKDVLAYLKTIENGHDDMAVKRILNVPKRGIGATSVEKVQTYAEYHEIDFFQALVDANEIPGLGKTGSKMKDFAQMIRVFRTKEANRYYESLSDFIDDVLQTTGYLEELKDADEEEAQERIENIDELISKAVAFEEKYMEENPEEEYGPSLGDFLAEVSLVADIDSVDQETDRVLLMTIHSSKGLEFSHVYLSGMEDGVFPGYMTITGGDFEEMEEERRLAYVGITRAKDELSLTCAKQRLVRGETQYNPVSRFLREIPEELLDGHLPQSRNVEFGGYSDDAYAMQQVRRTPFSGSAKPKAALLESPNKPYAKVELSQISKGSTLQSDVQYAVGNRVRHVKFGEGTVEEVLNENGVTQVTVAFDKSGQRVLNAAYARLRVL